MAVAIVADTINNTTLTVSANITGIASGFPYDVIRVIETSDDNERKYQLIGNYREWSVANPNTSGRVNDNAAPIRPYRIGVWDSTKVTPLDFDFGTGPYTGPPALAMSNLISLTSPLCGAVMRSTKVPGLYVDVRIHDFQPVQYRAKVSELTPMGTRYPVVIADRREGRRISGLVVYAPDNTQSKALIDLLLPENGRIYPIWLRTADTNRLLFHDMLMMPMDITIEPASRNNPTRRFITIDGVELDPRLLSGSAAT